MLPKMRYRLALDLGSTSLGWAMLRLNDNNEPCAVIKAGVRIFSDGREPAGKGQIGASLAATRREKRAMRRRRDRLLKRKARMMRTLIEYGFFPSDEMQRKQLETLNPYTLRAKGLDEALTPAEFGRALFHINQRRGFKSNRKTDKKDNDSGALKSAVGALRQSIAAYPLGQDGKPMKADQFDLLAWVERGLEETKDIEKPRTVGELLHKRDAAGKTVRARYHQDKIIKEDGKPKTNKYYDLYIDRAMIEVEFDALWAKQAKLNPTVFTENARTDLRGVLLFQRNLKPVKAGRCTFMPEEERAPLALPSTQRFRMYQEVNNLRILREGLKEETLTLQQRDDLIAALEAKNKLTFTQIRNLIGKNVQFNLEDPKRTELKGNATSSTLGKADLFGSAWFKFDEAKQDAIVMQLVKEENEAKLIRWLQDETGVDEKRAEAIAQVGLPEGYGSLCEKALARILPELQRAVVSFDKAVLAAGFEHHSHLWNFDEVPDRTFDSGKQWTNKQTGEILNIHLYSELPYYGEPLQRHVGFGSGKPEDVPEKRYGKIANPTVHIGLNQTRLVVNALIKRYGHPSEIIVELARDLKQSKEQRKDEHERQAENQKRNIRMRSDIASTLNISEERVSRDDIEKMILWEELSHNVADRRCPYSGAQISMAMLLRDEVEIEHILPFSQTLDDSLNNKTVAMRQANRIKGNRTPWEARNDFAAQSWKYEDMLARAEQMPKSKRYRFGEEGYQRWLKDDAGFLPRALNDTRHLSKVAFEYLKLVCPDTRVIPGRMTAMLRAKFGLNDVLGLRGEKNRNDHRHHAVDACVIGVTDQGLLQRFAKASASAREQQLNRLVETMPLPWDSYREHVQRAIERIWVSHKPDHSHEGAMHNDTAYGLRENGKVVTHKTVDGIRERNEENLKVIEMTCAKANERHGLLPDGHPKPYKGYKGDSNYCIEIVRNEKGKWEGEVISTFEAYQIAKQHGIARLRNPELSVSGKPLVMRLIRDDFVRAEDDGKLITLRVCKMREGQIALAEVSEANVDARTRTKELAYVLKAASSLQKAKARRITISPIGELRDPGFKE